MDLFRKVSVFILLMSLLPAQNLSKKYFDDHVPNDHFSFETETNNRNRTVDINIVYQWGSNPNANLYTNVVYGDNIFTSYGSQISIYDISDINNIDQIGTINASNNSWSSSKVINGYLFHLNSSGGMQVYDIMDVTQPSMVFSTGDDFYGRAYDIAFQDSLAFVAARQGGLMVYDISNMNEITFLDTFFTENHIDAVITHGDKIIIGDRNHTLTVLDYDAVDGFSLVSQTQNDYLWAWKFKKRNNIIYILNAPSSEWQGISTFDISNPESLVFIDSTSSLVSGGSWNFEISNDQQNIFTPLVDGIEQYQMDENGHIINIIFHSNTNVTNWSISNYENNLIVSDDRYLSIHVFDQNSIDEVAAIELHDGGANDIFYSGNILAAVDDANGKTRLFSTENIPTISEIGEIIHPENFYMDYYSDAMNINDNYLTLFNRYGKTMHIYDISVPSTPTEVTSYTTELDITDYIFYGNKMITVGAIDTVNENHFSIDFINIDNIQSPFLENQYNIDYDNSNSWNRKLLNAHEDTLTCVYMTGSDDSVKVYMIDISDPLNPQMIAEASTLIYQGYSYSADVFRCNGNLYLSSMRGNPWYRISYNNGIVFEPLQNNDENAYYLKMSCAGDLFYALNIEGYETVDAVFISEGYVYTYASGSPEWGYGLHDILNVPGYTIVSMGDFGIDIYENVSGGITPFILEIENQIINEDSSLSVPVDIINPSGGEYSVNVITDEDAVLSEYNSTSSVVYLQPRPDWFGATVINIQLYNDDGSNTSNTSFTLDVLPINDAPFIDSLLSPTLIDTFSTHPFSDHNIIFSWIGGDVDDDESFTLTIELEFFGNIYTSAYEEIADTIFNLSASELDPLLVGLNLNESVLSWYIETADSQYTAISSTGQFVLVRDQLSTIDNNLVPEVFALHQNYPNPFNPTTNIRYDLPEDAMVTITIYDLMGRSIRLLVNSNQSAGYRSVQWDATNNLGEPVSAGMYIYTIQSGEFRQVRKMVLLK